MMDKMLWFNEPKKWKIIDKSSASMFVTPKTDSWRESYYGFTVDDAPYFYTTCGGEFEAIVKITGDYKKRFDQMGLMIRINEKRWIKTGVEYVNNKINISCVVTIGKSDWSVVELSEFPKSIWIKVKRIVDAVKIYYSLDNKNFTMIRIAFFPDRTPVMVGLTAASPDGEGFNALFEGFDIKHLPDLRRLKWLENNKD
ncbi:MAG: DUF1349 domain-containing protein [Bacteroidales bacterium]|nr:DUF1349 domain-containing protein [Bacteroidales bacterium]MBS3775864.1 DUF1349 domain-containing protein [Bacteroidales bacterium]